MLAEPHSHIRYLCLEQGMRHLAGDVVDDLQILSAGMEDLEDVLIVHQQVPQRREVEPFGLRVDRCGFLRTGDLDQAQVGPVAVLAHELGVDCDERSLRKALNQRCKRGAVGDQWVNLHVRCALAGAARVDKREG